VLLKINKYFVKKFQKLPWVAKNEENALILDSCREGLSAITFDFDKKMYGLDNKMRRLILSLKMMMRDPKDLVAGKKKAYMHLVNEKAKLLNLQKMDSHLRGEYKNEDSIDKHEDNMSNQGQEFNFSVGGSDVVNLKTKLMLKRLDYALYVPNLEKCNVVYKKITSGDKDYNIVFDFNEKFECIHYDTNLP
jgi:ribosomal protein S1